MKSCNRIATAPNNRHKLKPGQTLVTQEMVDALERTIDELSSETTMPKEFVVPGENPVAAALDVARTVIRRAERVATSYPLKDSFVIAYLNRLSDLAWSMARWVEGDSHRTARANS